jgi:hypothetical protein
LADNFEENLDADILQCRLDIQRMRQNAANTASGGPQSPGQQEPETAHSDEAPDQPEAKSPEEEAYAVTRAEVDALLGSDREEGEAPIQDLDGVHFPDVDLQADTAEIPAFADEEGASLEIGAGEKELAETPAQSEPEDATDPEIAEMVKEAEEWMATIDDTPEVTTAGKADEAVEAVVGADSAGSTEELKEAKTPDRQQEPVAGAVPEARSEVGFDEMVSRLQGEEMIAPVEESAQPVAANTDEEKDIAAAEDSLAQLAEAAVSGGPAEAEEDVKLRIIRDMKEEADRDEADRGGIPRLDLSESALGGAIEARKSTAAARKRAGRKEKQARESPAQEERASAAVQTHIAGEIGLTDEEKLWRDKMDVWLAGTTAERIEAMKDKRIIARIVARDIERLCAAARPAKKNGVGS